MVFLNVTQSSFSVVLRRRSVAKSLMNQITRFFATFHFALKDVKRFSIRFFGLPKTQDSPPLLVLSPTTRRIAHGSHMGHSTSNCEQPPPTPPWKGEELVYWENLDADIAKWPRHSECRVAEWRVSFFWWWDSSSLLPINRDPLRITPPLLVLSPTTIRIAHGSHMGHSTSNCEQPPPTPPWKGEELVYWENLDADIAKWPRHSECRVTEWRVSFFWWWNSSLLPINWDPLRMT